MGNDPKLTPTALVRGYTAVLKVLVELEPSNAAASCLLEDARASSLTSDSVDAVITSPPYINVFNYHQNFRTAAEQLGWKPLQAARAEIGANRKFRQNRFLTVVQYAIDMHLSLLEMARVMRKSATAVLVVGKTSNVLRTPFQNGQLIKKLAVLGGAFLPVQELERVFVNRFGEQIREDIIVLKKQDRAIATLNQAKVIGIEALLDARAIAPPEARQTLTNAIEAASEVEPSPTFSIDVPRELIG
jgi:hypothetical protein